MSKAKKRKLLLFIGIIALLYIITEVMPSIVSKVTPTVTIEYGNLKVEDEVECYALRNETVYLAKNYGSLEYKVDEKRQVKVGTKVIDFTEESKSEDEETVKYSDMVDRLGESAVVADVNTAKRKGVFSTYIDGYENFFAVENFEKITRETAESKTYTVVDVKDRQVDKNQPIYKIADQSNWYLMFWIDAGDMGKYTQGRNITVQFDDELIQFSVEKVLEDKEGFKILLSSNRYYENFAEFRKQKVKIRSLDVDGIIIDNKYITTKGEDVGVYVVSKTGEAKFVKIKSLGSDGKKTAVASGSYYDEEGKLVNTVKVFDEIFKKVTDEK